MRSKGDTAHLEQEPISNRRKLKGGRQEKESIPTALIQFKTLEVHTVSLPAAPLASFSPSFNSKPHSLISARGRPPTSQPLLHGFLWRRTVTLCSCATRPDPRSAATTPQPETGILLLCLPLRVLFRHRASAEFRRSLICAIKLCHSVSRAQRFESRDPPPRQTTR